MFGVPVATLVNAFCTICSLSRLAADASHNRSLQYLVKFGQCNSLSNSCTEFGIKHGT